MSERDKNIAVVCWARHDALAQAMAHELEQLGYTPTFFQHDAPIPDDVATVLTFAPYGRWMQIPTALAKRSPRPLLVHWSTENPPDLNIPWALMKPVADARAWVDRLHESPNPQARRLLTLPVVRKFDAGLTKFRYVGEFPYARRRGWLDVYAESSEIYADFHNRHGLATQIVPWASVPGWGADLGLERDIDVVWFGQRRTERRSRLLERVRAELKARGIELLVLDGEEGKFVHGAARTQVLNRAKVTLNLLPTWYDHAFPYRFHIAAVNRSMVVTEPMLQHSSLYREGTHYVSAPVTELADRIAYYVGHEAERRAIAEQAYELVTTQMTMGHSVRLLMDYAEQARTARAS